MGLDAVATPASRAVLAGAMAKRCQVRMTLASAPAAATDLTAEITRREALFLAGDVTTVNIFDCDHHY